MTIVIRGIEINDNEPPRPDLAIPYNMMDGITQSKKRELYSIV